MLKVYGGGGMLEDLGAYKRDSKITMLPGIGNVGYEKFKEKGITTMSDLKKTKEWWNTTYKSDAGNELYILGTRERRKAKEAAEKYQKQND